MVGVCNHFDSYSDITMFSHKKLLSLCEKLEKYNEATKIGNKI